MKWAEQLAFAAVHNVALGSSPSNVTLDGKILDFGAVSTLPQLANFYVSPGTSVIDELGIMIRSLKDLANSATEFDPVAFRDFEKDAVEKVTASYENQLIFEILTVVGAPETFESVSKSDLARDSILDGFYSYYQYATRLRLDLLSSRYPISFQTGHGVEHIWSIDRPAHLDALRTAILSFVGGPNGRLMSTHWPITREVLREEITAYVRAPRTDIDIDSAIALFSARLSPDVS